MSHVLRPVLTFVFRTLPRWWRDWRDQENYLPATWIAERIRSREF